MRKTLLVDVDLNLILTIIRPESLNDCDNTTVLFLEKSKTLSFNITCCDGEKISLLISIKTISFSLGLSESPDAIVDKRSASLLALASSLVSALLTVAAFLLAFFTEVESFSGSGSGIKLKSSKSSSSLVKISSKYYEAPPLYI